MRDIRTFIAVGLAATVFALQPHPANPRAPIASAAATDAVLAWNEKRRRSCNRRLPGAGRQPAP
jgi:hypothetical protein